MLAILKKELRTYFTSVFIYLYYAVFFVFTGIRFVSICLTTYSTQFGYYVLSQSFFVVVAVIPFCTMRLFAQERRSKTDQLLFTAPVSALSVLIGKYLATVITVLLPVFISIVYPCIIISYGEMSVRFLLGCYIAILLMTLALVSIGMFISTLTANAVLAAVLSYVVYAVILFGRLMEGVFSYKENLYEFFHDFSIYTKYTDMVSGVVKSGDVVYLILITLCFFLLAWIALESRRQSGKKAAVYAVAVIIGFFAISLFFHSNTKVFDFTAEQLLTLSEKTKESVSKIKNPTDIYYMGVRSRANATYQEFLNAYKDLNSNITIHYKDVESDNAFRQQYLSDVSTVNESSILVVCGEKYIYLDSDNYITTTQTSAYSYEHLLEMEEQLTRAVFYVNTEETEKIYVISGHGEEVLNSNFRNLMLLNNYELKELELPTALATIAETIPENCKALFINAPQVDFSEEEIAVLEEYLQDGGKLFVTLDPLNEDLEAFFAFLKEYGLDVQPGVVIEQDEDRYVYDTPYYLVPKIEDTEFTKEILDKNLIILTMTSKGILKNGEKNGYTCTDILTTGAKAYSKVDGFDDLTTKTDTDISGPFSVATCSDNPDEGSLFLISSNIFFNEEADAESGGANRKLFIEIMKQLTDSQNSIWIDGKNVGSQMALYPSGVQSKLKFLMVIVIPVLVLLAGLAAVVFRHKNIGFYQLKKEEKNGEKNEEK